MIKLRGLLIVMAVLVLIAAATAGGSFLWLKTMGYASSRNEPVNPVTQPFLVEEEGFAGGDEEPPTAIVKEKEPEKMKRPMNILVAGIDKATSINGPPRPGPWRSDVIILVRVEPDDNKAVLLSIPRDTRVAIPGRGVEKIGHAHAYGKMPLLVETVEDFTGVRIDHSVCVDYSTFARMVDIMGGIEVDVPVKLKTKHFVFSPGKQVMDGKQAYEYVTNRDEPMADIARIDRQQIFLCSLLKNVKAEAGVLDLARMYLEFKKGSDTSLTLADIVKLALQAREMQVEDLDSMKVPGKPQYINGISYWIADREAVQRMCKEIFGAGEDQNGT